MSHRLFLAILALATLLCACGQGDPSPRDGQEYVEELAKKQNVYTVVNFRKTNGLAQENGGVRYYKMEFEVDVKCTKVYPPPGEVIIAVNFFIVCGHVGDTHTLVGSMEFQKAGNGWHVTNSVANQRN